MSGSWNDFNDARQVTHPIPKGTLAKVQLFFRPGGFDDPAQGWIGGYAARGASGAVYLECEFTVLEGAFARRKIFTAIGLYSPKGPVERSLYALEQRANTLAIAYSRYRSNRGDKKGPREVFDTIADQIRIGELIASSHLAPPRTFVIDVGVQDELRSARKSLSDFDMVEVASIMDRAPVTDEVIRHWKEKAGERQTVAFRSTVEHAEHVAAAFNEAGVSAAMVYGEMGDATRKTFLAAYDSGEIRAIVNIAALVGTTRRPPVSCCCAPAPTNRP